MEENLTGLKQVNFFAGVLWVMCTGSFQVKKKQKIKGIGTFN